MVSLEDEPLPDGQNLRALKRPVASLENEWMRERETKPADNEQDGVYDDRPVGLLRLLAVLVIALIVPMAAMLIGGIGVRAMVAGPSLHAVKQGATILFYASAIVFFLVDWTIRQEIKTVHPSLGYGFWMNPGTILKSHAHLFPQSRKRVLYWPLLVCCAVSSVFYMSLR